MANAIAPILASLSRAKFRWQESFRPFIATRSTLVDAPQPARSAYSLRREVVWPGFTCAAFVGRKFRGVCVETARWKRCRHLASHQRPVVMLICHYEQVVPVHSSLPSLKPHVVPCDFREVHYWDSYSPCSALWRAGSTSGVNMLDNFSPT